MRPARNRDERGGRQGYVCMKWQSLVPDGYLLRFCQVLGERSLNIAGAVTVAVVITPK